MGEKYKNEKSNENIEMNILGCVAPNQRRGDRDVPRDVRLRYQLGRNRVS